MNSEKYLPTPPSWARMYVLWLMLFVTTAHGATVPPAVECLDEATFNPATGKCECNGDLKGDGELCCYDDTAYRLCELKGDPLLYSSYNVDTVMDVPCAQSMYLTETLEGANLCRLQIYANNKYVAAANIYPERFSLEVTVNDGRERSIHVLGQTYWNPLKNALLHFEDLSADVSNRVLDFDGVTFDVAYDEEQNMWTIAGCGTIVRFRKYKGSRINQPQTPGMCIISSRSNSYKSVDEGNLCGLKKTYDFSPYSALEHKLLENAMLQQQDLEGQENVGKQFNKVQCLNASESLNLCAGPTRRSWAIERCAGFVLHPTIRVCMVAGGLSQAQIMEWFSACLKASCAQDRDSCRQMRRNEIVRKCNRRVTIKCDNW